MRNRTLLWGTALAILIAFAVGQNVLDHRQESARKLRAQQEQQRAQRKAAAIRAKLDSDDKVLNAACTGRWVDACVRPLAEAGNSAAQRNIGATLEADEQYSSAIEWYERGAEQGDTKAMYSLALLYAVGDSKKHIERRYDPLVDPKKAICWFTRAADMGDVDAMRDLGGEYEDGEKTTQNYIEARKWYLRAAEAGDRTSLGALGLMAEKGEGTTPNPIDAYRWFSLYCASWDGHSIQLGCSERDEIAARLNPAEVEKAQSLASEWEKQFGK